MATITKGKTFVSGEVVTPDKLHQMVDNASVSGIVNADIDAAAAIPASKLAATLDLSTKTLTLPAVTIPNGSELDRPRITGYAESSDAPTISGGTLTLNLAVANTFSVSLSANVTTLTINNTPTSGRLGSFLLIFNNTGTVRTITWPSSVKWAFGLPPTMTGTNNKRDIFSFLTVDGGTNWFASIVGQNY